MPLWALRNREGPSGALWRPHYAKNLSGVVESLGQPKSLSQLEARFTEATLDPELFAALQAPASAREACALLSQRYLATNHSAYQRLQAYLELALASGDYERHPERLAEAIHKPEPREARSRAFRELVLEAYDYRCAASRLRYITPDYRYLVEAAHLIPFAESQDDRPTNGIALTPNLHWAMDNQLIAPGPDHRWHVSPGIDTLNGDNRWLCELDDHPLVLPRNPDRQPCREALAWRLERLLS